MDTQDALLQEYCAYLKSKDAFIDRSFQVNRFYMLISFGLMFLFFILRDVIGGTPASLLVLTALMGMATSTLWWLNQDAYAYLIKIKVGTVLEKFEQEMPVQPHNLEYQEIQSRRQKKRSIVFTDIQKGIAFLLFAVFFGMFCYYGGMIVIRYFIPMV